VRLTLASSARPDVGAVVLALAAETDDTRVRYMQSLIAAVSALRCIGGELMAYGAGPRFCRLTGTGS
jgi:hypothetical protein